MRRAVPLVVITCGAMLALGLPAAAERHRPGSDRIRLGYFSEQSGPSRAVIGARIQSGRGHPGRASRSGLQPGQPALGAAQSPVESRPQAIGPQVPNPYPTLQGDSPLLRNPAPVGPGSFWYGDGRGHTCLYVRDGVLPCYIVVASAPAGVPAARPVSAAEIAASIADRLGLASGQIDVSPGASGLTGVASWFWLDPAPQTMTLAATLGGESVTVTAEPAVSWRFGDGAGFAGRAGVPYRPGPPPPEAVTHVYETRCLPGDRGRNPYVLGSCGEDGYRLDAVVVWRINYRASGPVGASGSLPTRTTESSLAYPVSEARAFLAGGASQ